MSTVPTWLLRPFQPSLLPSISSGSLTDPQEKSYRKKTACFIEESCSRLLLPRLTIASALVFFHRFFSLHDFKVHDRFEIAVTCIFLACKVEETPKKIVTVIVVCMGVKNGNRSASEGAGEVVVEAEKKKSEAKSAEIDNPSPLITSPPSVSTPLSSTPSTVPLDPKSPEFASFKEKILLLERVLLHTMSFDLCIEHPYKHLVSKMKSICHYNKLTVGRDSSSSSSSSDAADSSSFQSSQALSTSDPSPPQKSLSTHLCQTSVNLLNDSYQTRLPLIYTPYELAVSTICIAGKFKNIYPAKGGDWEDVLNVDREVVKGVFNSVTEIYKGKGGGREGKRKREAGAEADVV